MSVRLDAFNNTSSSTMVTNVMTGKTVTISGLTLGGSAAGDYTLTQPTTTANIAQLSRPIVKVSRDGDIISLSFASENGVKYFLEFKTDLTNPRWAELQTVTGNGNELTLTDSSATSRTRFYRVRVE